MTRHINPKQIILFVVVVFTFSSNAQTIQLQAAAYNQKLPSPSLLFMENKGQVADTEGNLRPDILFTANNAGVKLYLTSNSIHYQFTRREYPDGYDPHKKASANNLPKEAEFQKQIKTSTYRFTVELQGANSDPEVSTEKQSSYYENYYLAQCPEGITGVHGYEKIIYRNVYPDIDWIIYSRGGYMEYDFLVHPGGDPAQIRLKIKDAESVSITAAGELLMKTSLGEVKEKAPVSYTDVGIIETHFKKYSNGTIGFEVQPQPGKELRIDPPIVWSTYFGGSGYEYGRSCKTDGSGNVYITGTTTSLTGIASGGFQNTNAYTGTSSEDKDAYLAKFDSSGNRLWATYYGGRSSEDAYSCAVDGNNNVYMAGRTLSTSVIAANGFKNSISGGIDAFLVKFNSAGARLWGTYYGGDNDEENLFCCVDGNNNVYLSGNTNSPTGIASGGFMNTLPFLANSPRHLFLVKFTGNGNRLWGTYYGGNSLEVNNCCTTDRGGNVYLAGTTSSETGIAYNGFQNTFVYGPGNEDAFLVKFDSNGNRLWGTYYGATDNSIEKGFTCVTDTANNVFLAGFTYSTTGLGYNGFQTNSSGSGDGFIVKFSSTGNRLWSTYFGGNKTDAINGSCTDADGNIFITGSTSSTSGIAYYGFQDTPQNSGTTAFIAKIGNAGSLIWSSYFKGNWGAGCAADNFRNVFICGYTNFTSGIVLNGFQNNHGGGGLDAYVAKIGTCITASTPVINALFDTICSGSSTVLSIVTGNMNNNGKWQWYKNSCGGTPVDTGTTVSIMPSATTTYYVRGEDGCAAQGNCARKTIYVLPGSVVGSITVMPPAICPGDTVTVAFTGNVPVNTYVWNWGSGTVVNGSNAGPYKVKYVSGATIHLTVNNGTCNALFTASPITFLPHPLTAFSVSKTTGCSPLSVTFSNHSQNATSWYWNSGDGTNSTDSVLQPHVYTTGSYIISLQATNGTCSQTVLKTLRVVDKPVAGFTISPAVNIPVQLSQANFTFTNASQNATRYAWDFGDAQRSPLQHPAHTYLLPGNYAVTLFAYNSQGCADTFKLKPLVVVADSALRISNVFSPNNDGINDTWEIDGLQNITNSKVSIFNRWGQTVYKTTGYSKPWDGNYNGKALPVGTYYYVININNRSYTGSVTLLR